MTQLYLTFFIIGLLIFVAIAAYSWWQAKKVRQEKGDAGSKLNKEGLADLLLDNKQAVGASRKAKQLDKLNDAKGPLLPSSTTSARVSKDTNRVVSSDKRKKPSVKTELPVLEINSPVEKTNRSKRVVDDAEIANAELKREKGSSSVVTELVARIKNQLPIEQKELLTLFRAHNFKFHRKVHIYGLNQLTDLWRDIEFELPSARFVELGIAIQLADREGAMSNKELQSFQTMISEFSSSFDAPFEFSMDIDEALLQAKVLDQMGRRYDSMAVLNVVPRSRAGFRIADIESCARDLNMKGDKSGVFLKTTGQKHQINVLYRLACTNSAGDFGLAENSSEPVHDLVVYMNVPATKTPEVVFQDMVKDANSLATWLDGKVVDRDGKVMTQRSYSVLTQQISDITFSMQQDGLNPGDAVSKKLF